MIHNFDELSIEEIKKGVRFDEKNNAYLCNICGAVFEVGEIFSFDCRFFEASRAVEIHLNKEHENYFEKLLYLNSKYIPFTDNQKKLLTLIHSGLSDKEIAKKMDVTPSTVRHQKFMFREKAKQAKMVLSIYELTTEHRLDDKENFLPVHTHATMVDDRYNITVEERDKILESTFVSLLPLKLNVFSSKEKKKIVILTKIAEQFSPEKKYSEAEVNTILKDIFEDYVTLRRYLIEYGFMERTNNGKEYWLK